MVLFRDVLEVPTEKGISYVDLTERIAKLVKECKIVEGMCNIFVPATTAALMVNENDRMLIEDFRRTFNAIDERKLYSHTQNAFSHLRTNLLDTEKTIPVSSGKLLLGEWQSIMLWEFDTKPRQRNIVITVTGD